MSVKDILELLNKVRECEMSPAERCAQRLSFAYGNTNISNGRITRETVERASDRVSEKSGNGEHSLAPDDRATEIGTHC